MDFRLRPAEPSDLEFIWHLRVATMRHMIEEAYGWDEATERAYAAESLGGMIVLVGEKPVGVVTLADWGDQLHVVWMAIASEVQGRGLGRALVESCQRQAQQARKPLTLQVLQGNPAVAMYAVGVRGLRAQRSAQAADALAILAVAGRVIVS
ncbi:MAG: GNAT family N-acetyltransferase [Planctomycetota bacterium]|nr:MAG: GNAT family N-acetyltransferase [Planctomycetota bacterium]